MEGVGARLGRSSTRYGGPTTVFSGPVRKWKKKWVHVSPSAASNNNNNSNNHNHNHHSQTTTNNGTNGNNGSHLLFYKWTPNSQTNGGAAANNSNSADKTPVKEDAVTDADEPPRRKFKYIPIAMLEEQKNEAAEMVEDEEEAIPEDSDIGTAEPSTAEPTPKSNDFDEKPDMNDMPTEETEAPDNQIERQDLNESTLDLSLGLTAHDGDHDSDSKTDQIKDGQLERVK